MDKFLVRGGRRLAGTVAAANAKNAVLPILAATLLTDEPSTITGVPLLEDTVTMLRLLESMGARVSRRGRTVTVDAGGRIDRTAQYDIVRKMRASYYVLGPLLARFGDANRPMPMPLISRITANTQ